MKNYCDKNIKIRKAYHDSGKMQNLNDPATLNAGMMLTKGMSITSEWSCVTLTWMPKSYKRRIERQNMIVFSDWKLINKHLYIQLIVLSEGWPCNYRQWRLNIFKQFSNHGSNKKIQNLKEQGGLWGKFLGQNQQ